MTQGYNRTPAAGFAATHDPWSGRRARVALMDNRGWRPDAARALEDAARALLKGQDRAAGTAFGTAVGYLLAAARAGDQDAGRVMAALRESMDPNEPTRRLEFSPEESWLPPRKDEDE